MKVKRNGVGISNIMNRAAAVNGKVEIRSAVGAGCSLQGVFAL
jgi:signal transduction histidine kinase